MSRLDLAMSSPEAGANGGAETQGEETPGINETLNQDTTEEIGNTQPTKARKERVRNQGAGSVREQGKSLFPISKVQKIIKADKVFSPKKNPIVYVA